MHTRLVFSVFLILIFVALLYYVWRKSVRFRVATICTRSHMQHPPVLPIFSTHPSSSNYSYFNPSACRDADGSLVYAVRHSNWRQDSFIQRIGSILKRLKEKRIRTHIHTWKRSLDGKRRMISIARQQHGEDPRICLFKGQLFMLAVMYVDDAITRPTLFQLDRNQSMWKEVVVQIPTEWGHQKNWCPFASLNEQHLLVHTDSFPSWRVRRIDIENGMLTTIVEEDMRHTILAQFTSLRCSTSPVDYDRNHYLMGLHTVPIISGEKVYSTVLVLMDKVSLMPVSCSRELCFGQKGHVQFTSGLVRRSRNRYWIMFGSRDAEMHVVSLHRRDIDGLMQSIHPSDIS